jgi:hypothetical protein
VAGGVLLQHRPGAVRQHPEGRPVLRRQTQERPDGRAGGPAVRRHDEGAALLHGRDLPLDDGHHPIGHLDPGLAATGPDVGSGGPQGQLLAEPLLQLRAGQSLPRAGIGLPQSGVEVDVQSGEVREGASRRVRPGQVRTDDPPGVQPGQSPSGIARLGHAGLVEGNVGLPLESPLGVPWRAAVAPEDDAPCVSAHVRSGAWRPAWTASGRAMKGQSFHSRSMA